MKGSTDLEGVHDTLNAFDLERARLPDRPDRPDFRPGSKNSQISASQTMGGAATATGDEVATRVHKVFPLPMGIKRGGRCE